MSIIRTTAEGIEVDGILLKDTVDLKAFIAAHKPADVSVGIAVHQPYPLEAFFHVWSARPLYISLEPLRPLDIDVRVTLSQPQPLTAEFLILQPFPLSVLLGLSAPEDLLVTVGTSQPRYLTVPIHVNPPVQLTILMHVWTNSELYAVINSHRPRDVIVDLGVSLPSELQLFVKPEYPIELTTDLFPIPYHRLDVSFEAFHWKDFSTIIASCLPSDITMFIDSHSPGDLYAYINPMYVHSFKAWFFVVKQGAINLRVYLAASHRETKDFSVFMHIWSLGVLTVEMGLGGPRNLYAHIWAWTPHDLSVAIATTYPPPLEVGFLPQPEDGVDLKVIHGFYKFTHVSVDFNVWTEFWNLQTYLWGLYKSEFEVEFTMGSYHPLVIPLPGTSGYKNLFVTCKPASRIMTTIIPVYTIEIKDLYVSINQGWPCGFGSSYKLLSVTFDYAYFHAFVATFKVIDGSGTDLFGVFINRAYFDTYINKFDIHISIPYQVQEPNVKIVDKVDIVYDNEFADLYQDIMQITFSWPRIRLWSGQSDFSVELLAYRGDKIYELSVVLYAQRQEPVRQLTSRPIMPRESDLADPVWPDVFQVTEIELWGDDPPEVVRRIEIKFEEQIHEYYWVSSEQRAVSKKLWEQWSFLTRGYLPSAEFSGQIDYLTMRTLSSMKFYDTIDQAVKAMISNFLYSGKTSFRVSCNPHGGYHNLSVIVSVWDRGRLKPLLVNIEPMHTQTLAVNLTAT
jgi:hypothetical protein